MSNAFLPRGAQFQRSPDGITFTTIGEAKRVSFSLKGDFLDVSNLSSPTVYKEFLAGMIDGGSVKVEANFLNSDTVQNLLMGDFAAQSLLTWKFELPNTRGNFVFTAFVEDLSPDFDVEKAAVQSISLKISGAVTWTPNA